MYRIDILTFFYLQTLKIKQTKFVKTTNICNLFCSKNLLIKKCKTRLLSFFTDIKNIKTTYRLNIFINV